MRSALSPRAAEKDTGIAKTQREALCPPPRRFWALGQQIGRQSLSCAEGRPVGKARAGERLSGLPGLGCRMDNFAAEPGPWLLLWPLWGQ